MKQSLPLGKIPGALLSDLLARYPIDDGRVLIGPGTGHDSAAISFGDTALVIKTDPITFVTDQPAHHLIHVNANDIACQGATPKWLLVTVLLPAGLVDAEVAKDLFEQLQVAARSVGVSIVGGHTEITNGLDRPLLIGTMLGEVDITRLVRPSDAKPGDRILMTQSAGIEGTAILGMEAESNGVSPEIAARARAFIHSPGISVLAAARSLHGAGAVSAMHDPTEGGIATAIREMAIAAGTGVMIARDAIPVAPETAAITTAYKIDPLGLISSGALLATVPPDRMCSAEEALQQAEIPFAWIGKLTEASSGMTLREGTNLRPLPEFVVDELARVLAGEQSA